MLRLVEAVLSGKAYDLRVVKCANSAEGDLWYVADDWTYIGFGHYVVYRLDEPEAQMPDEDVWGPQWLPY